jgi:flagellar hook-length control protein FliK
MDTNLITISNLVAPVENVSVTPSNTGSSKQTCHSSIISSDSSGTGKTKKTDNSFRQVHKKTIEKQSGDSEQSLDQSQNTTQTAETQDCTKPKIQQTNPEETSETNSTQTLQSENPAVVTVVPVQQTNEQVLVEQAVVNEIPNTTVSLQSSESTAGVQTIELTMVESSEPANVVPETETKIIPTQASKIQNGYEDSKTEASVNPLDNVIVQKTEDTIIENQILNSETGISEQVIVSDSDQKQFAAQADVGNQQIKTDAPDAPDASATDTTQVISPTSETKPASGLVDVSNVETSAVNGKTPEITANPQVVQIKSPEPQIQEASNIDTEKSGQPNEKQTDDKTVDLKTIPQIPGNSEKENPDVRNDTSGDSAVRKLNFINTHIPDNDTKDTGNSTSDGNANTASEQMLHSSSLQNTTIEQSSNIANSTKTAEPTSQNQLTDVSADVGKQILESIHSSMSRQGEDQQITVRLNPPELGSVVIKFQEQDNQVTGILEVSKSQTRFEIEQALPQIVRDLVDSGIQVRRLEVVLSSQEDFGRETLREQFMQNGNSQNENANDSGSGQSGPDRGKINEFLVNNINYQYKSQFQDAFTSGGSINMLM